MSTMDQDRKMQQVPSFQIFIRDNKSKMNAHYPFLSQEQIMLKLRQQWKQLDASKRQSYSKLVMAKTKNCKMVNLTRHRSASRKIVKLTRYRSPSRNIVKHNTSKKTDHIFMKDDKNYELNQLCDDSYFSMDIADDFNNSRDNSPFMKNKIAIDNLNAEFNSTKNEQSKTIKQHGLVKTYTGRVFQLQNHTQPFFSEFVGSNKNGILKSKDRRNLQGHVSFSAPAETLNHNDNYKFDDDDIDEEVLYVEETKTTKENFKSGNKRDNAVYEEVLYRAKSQIMKDPYDTHGSEYVQNKDENLSVKGRKKSESKERKVQVEDSEVASLTSSEKTPTRFSKRLQKLIPDTNPSAALGSRSISGEASQKKLKQPVPAISQKIFSNTNNTPSMERRHLVLSPLDGESSEKKLKQPVHAISSKIFLNTNMTQSMEKRHPELAPLKSDAEASHKKLKPNAMSPKIFLNTNKTQSMDKKHPELSQEVSDISNTNSKKCKDYQLNEETVKNVQDKVFSSSLQISPDRILNGVHKTSDKLQKKTRKSNLFPEPVTQPVQRKAVDEYTTRGSNIRMTPSYQNKIAVDSGLFKHIKHPLNPKEFKHLQGIFDKRTPLPILSKPNADVKRFESSTCGTKGTTLKCQKKLRFAERDSNIKSPVCTKLYSDNNSHLKSDSKDCTNNNSLDSNSETDVDTNDSQSKFLANMADQTTSALLQAIERLNSLSSPQNCLIKECVLDDVCSSDLSEHDEYGCDYTEKKSLCHMFQDIQNNTKRTIMTPAKQRMLSSSTMETPSNFMTMFADTDIFL